MATKFDHTKECFIEAMGFDAKDMRDLSEKLADTSRFIIKNEPKISELTEEIAKVFSYNELLIMATTQIIEKTNTIISKHPELLLTGVLKDILDALESEEEN